MEILGILIKKEALEKGKNENGNEWQRITAVFQTVEQNPKNVAVVFINNNVKNITEKKIGVLYRVQADAESRNYNGRWYTDLRGWKCNPAYQIEEPAQTSGANAPATTTQTAKEQPEDNFEKPLEIL